MNISDFVKYDERSEKLVKSKANSLINKELKKYGFDRDNILFIDKQQKLLKWQEDTLAQLQKDNMPLFDDALITEIAIQWAEANGYTSFTKAVTEVYGYRTGLKGEYDLTSSDPKSSFYTEEITVAEAKEMLATLQNKNEVSEEILYESLRLANVTSIKQQKENSISISDYDCKVCVNEVEYKIPTMIIKHMVYSVMHESGAWDAKNHITEIQEIKLPRVTLKWPSAIE